MPIDFREYTSDEMAKQLGLLEIHLRQFEEEDSKFCMECCAKHLLAVEGLADEGVTFFPEDPKFWKGLASWSLAIRRQAKTGNVTMDNTQQWAEEARLHRKKIQGDHMGFLGQCDCVSGFEPCCKVKG